MSDSNQKRRSQLSTAQTLKVAGVLNLHRADIESGKLRAGDCIQKVKEAGIDVTFNNIDNILATLGIKPPFGFNAQGPRPAPPGPGFEQRLKAIEERLAILEGKQPPPQFALAGG